MDARTPPKGRLANSAEIEALTAAAAAFVAEVRRICEGMYSTGAMDAVGDGPRTILLTHQAVGAVFNVVGGPPSARLRGLGMVIGLAMATASPSEREAIGMAINIGAANGLAGAEAVLEPVGRA